LDGAILLKKPFQTRHSRLIPSRGQTCEPEMDFDAWNILFYGRDNPAANAQR